jgi:hypothetical protein
MDKRMDNPACLRIVWQFQTPISSQKRKLLSDRVENTFQKLGLSNLIEIEFFCSNHMQIKTNHYFDVKYDAIQVDSNRNLKKKNLKCESKTWTTSVMKS